MRLLFNNSGVDKGAAASAYGGSIVLVCETAGLC